MMVDGGNLRSGDAEGGGGGLIISDLLRKENQETRLDEHKKKETLSKLLYFTLPHYYKV